jgi:hypothetical protein
MLRNCSLKRTPYEAARLCGEPSAVMVVVHLLTGILDRSQVVQMIAGSESFWQGFNGELSFGTIYSKGNESMEFNLNSQALYVRERWDALAGFEYTRWRFYFKTNASYFVKIIGNLKWNVFLFMGTGTLGLRQ